MCVCVVQYRLWFQASTGGVLEYNTLRGRGELLYFQFYVITITRGFALAAVKCQRKENYIFIGIFFLTNARNSSKEVQSSFSFQTNLKAPVNPCSPNICVVTREPMC